MTLKMSQKKLIRRIKKNIRVKNKKRMMTSLRAKNCEKMRMVKLTKNGSTKAHLLRPSKFVVSMNHKKLRAILSSLILKDKQVHLL